MTKPILKWVGGKTQIMDDVKASFPNTIHNYREPFVGGGSVLISLLKAQKENKINITGKVYAYDLNPALIGLYKNIQEKPNDLFCQLNFLYDEFFSCPVVEKGNRKPESKEEGKSSQESYYYWTRDLYNSLMTDKSSIGASAIFIFMNKAGWRGVFRESKNGFNVPYGHPKNLGRITKQEILSLSELIQPVEFKIMDYEQSLDEREEGDFIYMDPPYAPLNNTSFVGYTKDGFGIEEHTKLFELIKKINQEKKVNWSMSNSYSELIKEHFENQDYIMKHVVARRAIHSKNPGSTTTEVIVMNHRESIE